MTPGSKGHNQNDAASSQSPMEETTAMNRQRLTTSTLISLSPSLSSSPEPPGNSLHAPSLPTLPFDLEEEILCRLPVKFLLQLRCICKSWNSLISDDSKFAKKHLCVSTTRHRLILSSTNSSHEKCLLWDSQIPSVFTTSVMQTHLSFPMPLHILCTKDESDSGVSTCDGILCFNLNEYSPLLWNPSIRKHKILPILPPPLEYWRRRHNTLFSFGYDHFTNNYKIVAVSSYRNKKEQEVCIHTLGTNSWRRIEDFPYYGRIYGTGIFVNDAVNWLTFDGHSQVIVSLDLEKESYQNLLQPDYQMVNDSIKTLGVLRDCLCILTRSDTFAGGQTVWLMKEYGNQKSWTKLCRVPYMEDHGFLFYTKAIYISDDDQVLLEFLKLGNLKLVVYDSRNGTFNIPEIQNINGWMAPKVCVESLISPFGGWCTDHNTCVM